MTTPAGAVDERTRETLETVDQFNRAFDRHDVDAVMAVMTEDCVFETTSPPDGERYEGQAAVRAFCESFFRTDPGARFSTEEVLALGEHAVVRWVYHWGDGGGGHVRGIDVFRVNRGKVAATSSYVKG